MKRLLALIALLGAFGAHAAPASRESVENLLAVTKAESMMSSLYAGMEQMMRQSMEQAIKGSGATPNAEQRRAIDAMPAKFATVIKEEMSWQKLKPQYVQIYQESFDQEEIDGLLSFYASPSGQAAINKMPLVMQKSMALSQTMMQSMMPKVMAAMKQALADAKISTGK